MKKCIFIGVKWLNSYLASNVKCYTCSDYASRSISYFILLQNIHLEEGSVGGEQRVVWAELVPLLEQPLLERQHLRDGLHHDVRAPEAGLGLRHVADVVRAPRHELLPRRGVILEPGLNMMRVESTEKMGVKRKKLP